MPQVFPGAHFVEVKNLGLASAAHTAAHLSAIGIGAGAALRTSGLGSGAIQSVAHSVAHAAAHWAVHDGLKFFGAQDAGSVDCAAEGAVVGGISSQVIIGGIH